MDFKVLTKRILSQLFWGKSSMTEQQAKYLEKHDLDIPYFGKTSKISKIIEKHKESPTAKQLRMMKEYGFEVPKNANKDKIQHILNDAITDKKLAFQKKNEEFQKEKEINNRLRNLQKKVSKNRQNFS